MIVVNLAKEQLEALLQILQNTQIKGSDAEFLVELKKVLQKALLRGEGD